MVRGAKNAFVLFKVKGVFERTRSARFIDRVILDSHLVSLRRLR